MDSCDVAVNDLWSDLTVVSLEDLANTRIVRWLYVFIVIEDSVHLRMSAVKICDPLVVIVELHPILRVVRTSEAVVGQ